MIKSIWSDNESFKKVDFSSGFNIILADTTATSKEKDSRNGLGKTSLVRITSYLLGSSKLEESKGTPLEEWTFYGKFVLRDCEITIARTPRDNSKIFIESSGTFLWANYAITPEVKDGRRFISVSAWTHFLGRICFNLSEEQEKLAPTFRSLIGYFIRNGKDAFSSPFEHFRKQKTYDIQINNAYLLGLDWHDSQRAEILRQRKFFTEKLKEAGQYGVMQNFIGARGELEAERSRIHQEIQELEQAVNTFSVAPVYSDLEDDADDLTSKINTLSNENYTAKLTLRSYEEMKIEDSKAESLDIKKIYQEARTAFRDDALRRIELVAAFHTELVSNRIAYLEKEILSIKASVAERNQAIHSLDMRRNKVMKALSENRALDHYIQIRKTFEDSQERLALVSARIEAIQNLESSKARLKIDTELARQTTVENYNDSLPEREKAYTLFNDASRELYEAPGNLLINVGAKGGYEFSYQIQGRGSTGIGSGVIFCYDITLAQIWAKTNVLNTLFHDSEIFDPMDPRQVTHALTFAKERCENLGFQYICSLNSNRLPETRLIDGTSFRDYIAISFSDATKDGGLFGMRF